MSSTEYQVPDLASILNTLSSYGRDSTTTANQPLASDYRDQGATRALNPSRHQCSEHTPDDQPTRTPSRNSPQPAKSVQNGVDPTAITEWRAALRYVTRLDNQDHELGDRIRKMISNQLENERQWWEGREALIQKQKSRLENRKRLDEVLRTVGGDVTTGTDVNDDAAELRSYDLKVHRAATTMVKAMSAELRDLGIPFFGTRPNLIAESKSQPSDASVNGSKGESQSQTLTRDTLFKLQRQMIQHLEDMYKD